MCCSRARSPRFPWLARPRHRCLKRSAAGLTSLCLALCTLPALVGCVSDDRTRVPVETTVVEPEEDLRLSEEEAPPDRDAAVRLVDEGRTLVEQGEHGAAFAAFEKARTADPSYGLAHLEGAIRAQYIGVDDEGVRKRFDRAAVLLADNPRVHFERAAFEESHGNADAAVEGYRRALDLRPSLTDARLALARALLTTGDQVSARETFRQVLEVEPENLAALLGRAESSERLGDVVAAEDALRAVVDLFPDVAPHRQRLISFYERTGQVKKAEKETRRLEKMEPRERRRLRSLKPSRKR